MVNTRSKLYVDKKTKKHQVKFHGNNVKSLEIPANIETESELHFATRIISKALLCNGISNGVDGKIHAKNCYGYVLQAVSCKVCSRSSAYHLKASLKKQSKSLPADPLADHAYCKMSGGYMWLLLTDIDEVVDGIYADELDDTDYDTDESNDPTYRPGGVPTRSCKPNHS